ncbi:MAG: hypothetical protein LH617_02235 [Ramlibacter sp.]|nr:hypothetical protein [Ramlibacter sp.]
MFTDAARKAGAAQRKKVNDVVRELRPFLLAHGAVPMILTFVPALGTWLARALGFN